MQHAPATPASFHDLARLAAATSTRSALISPAVVAGSVRAGEATLLTASGVAVAAVYLDATATELFRYLVAAAAGGVLATAFLSMLGLYNISALANPLRSLVRLVGGWALATAIAAAMVFLLKFGDAFSRVWLVSWFATGAVCLVVGRTMLATQVRRWSVEGRLNRRAVVYGSGPACEALLRALEADKATDISICGVFDDRGERAGDNIVGYPNCGRLDDLIAFARTTRVDMVLLALPISAETRLMSLLQKLWLLPVDIRLAASASRLRLARRAYDYVGNVGLVPLADKPIPDWGMVAKSIFDKVASVILLVGLSPVMAATALAIRLDSKGPALFRQKRYGFNNELIEVYKFRSMFTEQTDHAAARLVTRDDPRVTRVGRFIRKTSLDELPQLINVLKGTLSLVGPRPHAVSAKAAGKLYDEAIDSYFARHKVKPGITGWAQINGWRGETDTEEKLVKRIEHDLEYIENWSLLLDLWILLRTPMSLVKTDNAY